MKCNKRVIQKKITPAQLQYEKEHSMKWFKITYNIYYEEEAPERHTREYQKKENVQRILDAETTYNPVILVLEVVDDG